MPARLCAKCEEHWPIVAGFTVCPGCGGPTVFSAAKKPTVTPADALDVQLHRQFDEYYERREQERERRGEPSPETLGYLDARREIASGARAEAPVRA